MRVRHLGYLSALAAAFSLSSDRSRGQLPAAAARHPAGRHAGSGPIVSAKINGVEARFMLDSGAFYSMISDDVAAKYQLQVNSVSSSSFYIRGVGGNERARIATVNSFEFIGVARTQGHVPRHRPAIRRRLRGALRAKSAAIFRCGIRSRQRDRTVLQAHWAASGSRSPIGP